ncbi:hypothetical protein BHF69_06255 [Anaerostipes sp. 992a]|uniref:caspase family protein n=1 Tax=Anaerostipes sp. 992a TaxID=1261637 RepID=UPI0009530946|nr:caspase family protein [Anaerostipes sp. 992a]OLR62313.1 hypothetical protein BHF69_06255 [Anaerostipes sp. 992a]
MNKAEQIMYEKRKKAIGKIFAIAIGINEYKIKADNLKNCCTDAKAVFETLKSQEYFSLDDNSILITSDANQTKKQDILNTIYTCDGYIDENTNIIFYYSGHGCNINDTFHFWASDSELPSANVISIDEITDILSNMSEGKYKSITILIDACQQKIDHSKRLGKQSRNFLNEYIDDAKGIGIIYSCSKGECSLDTFNKNNISVFTYLILQALNGHIDATDANCLTFNKLNEFLQLESRKISRENIHINQHPQVSFKGNDIVYAFIPDECLQDHNIALSVCTYDELFMEIMHHLQGAASLVCYDKGLVLDNDDDIFLQVPSERFIRQVCDELSQMGLLDKDRCSEVLSKAFTYFNLIHLDSSESIQPSVKIQIIDDTKLLCDDLYIMHDRYIDRL